jgi:hypothetical protein
MHAPTAIAKNDARKPNNGDSPRAIDLPPKNSLSTFALATRSVDQMFEQFRYAIQSSYDWFATEKVGQPANATPFGIQPRLNR